MKIKNIFLYTMFLTFFLNVIKSKAQTDLGYITYSKVNYIPEMKETVAKYGDKISDMKKGVFEISKKLEYTLSFSNNESIFSLNKKLNTDKNESYFNMANTISGGKGKYYTNIKTKEFLRQTQVGGQHFLIIKNLDSVKWTLINETKMIGKYQCFKATTIKVNIGKKIYYKNVEAWYCPSLPNAFGPIGYGNLPGLILELKIEKGAIFKAKKIIINPKEKIVIKKPSKGEKVNEEEFQESCKQMHYKQRGM